MVEPLQAIAPSVEYREASMVMVQVEEQVQSMPKVLRWILSQIEVVSQFLGVLFEGVEMQALELFIALEREISLLGSVK